MALPSLGVSVDFANGPAFGNPLILGDASTPLGVGILADTASDVVDVSDITLRASIRRGRNRILNKFEAGSATVILEDTNGDWVPTNTSSPYYGKLVPLRKIRIWADYNSVRYYLFSGYVTSYDTNFKVGVDDISSVTLQCVDAFRLFSNVAISTVAGTSAGQTTGERMNNLLDVPTFPTSMRAIDTGDSTVQADPGTERDLLSALQVIENSEFGGFFIDPEGNATFLSRDTVAQKADQTATIIKQNGVYAKPADLAKIISISTLGQQLLGQTTSIPIDVIYDEEKLHYVLQSNLSAPKETSPIAFLSDSIAVYPSQINKISLRYYKQPEGISPTTGQRTASLPKFGFTVANATELYDPLTSVDFELPEHYTQEIVIEMASMIGVNLRDSSVYQYGATESQKIAAK